MSESDEDQLCETAMDATEEPYFGRFESFVDAIDWTSPPIFVFFSTGLINVAAVALEFIPTDANVVLIGGNLTAAEVDWLAMRWARIPVHNVEITIDDKTVWEFLFRSARGSFCWLDVDCFVLEPSLLDEVLDLKRGEAMRGVFVRSPRPLLCTPLLSVAVDAIAGIREFVGEAVSPGIYATVATGFGRNAPHAVCRALTRPIESIVRRQVETDADMRPIIGQQGILDIYEDGTMLQTTDRDRSLELAGPVEPIGVLFSTTVVFQLCCAAAGLECRAVRQLPGLETSSNEVFHAGAIGYHRSPSWRRSRLQAYADANGIELFGGARELDVLSMLALLATGAPAGYDEIAESVFGLRGRNAAPTAHLIDSYVARLAEYGIDAANDRRFKFLAAASATTDTLFRDG